MQTFHFITFRAHPERTAEATFLRRIERRGKNARDGREVVGAGGGYMGRGRVEGCGRGALNWAGVQSLISISLDKFVACSNI